MARLLVLYAEDEPEDIFFVRQSFARKREDVEVHAVGNGKEAIEYLCKCLEPCGAEQSARPDLVFLDIYMPKLGGFEVLAWIRARPELKGLPVIVLSSSDARRDQQRAASPTKCRFNLTMYMSYRPTSSWPSGFLCESAT